MRTMDARLGVVPGALYHHVRNKEQLQDLVLDAVLAEIDAYLDPSQPWTEQLKVLAHLLREVLEDHPGLPGSSRPATRSGRAPSPWPRHSLHHCRPPGVANTKPAWPYSSWSTTPPASRSAAPHRRQRAARRRRSHQNPTARVPPLAASDRFPALVALGEHVWVDNRDQRFTAGLDVFVDGLEQARRSPYDRRSEDDRPPPSDHVKKHGR
jgi:AcrR family transcriptional regulator